MSKNVIDAVINYSNKYDTEIGLIASRRQIDHLTGYTGFTTAKLSSYVRSKTSKVFLQRDHGGPYQGSYIDDGVDSAKVDTKYFHAVHVDPFKSPEVTFNRAISKTVQIIEHCLDVNSRTVFEVGTEQAIFPYEPSDLDKLLNVLEKVLGPDFDRIKYAVVQSGTGLDLGKSLNTGTFNPDKLSEFVKVCNAYGVKSKEHNGDFLSADQIKSRFDLGLSGLNIAPELGQVETSVYLSNANEIAKVRLSKLALDSNYWRKWAREGFDPHEQREELIMMAGHYLFNTVPFKQIVERHIGDLTSEIQTALEERIHFLVTSANG